MLMNAPNRALAAIFDLYARKRLGAAAIDTLLTRRGQRTQAGKPWNTRAVPTVLRNRGFPDAASIGHHRPGAPRDRDLRVSSNARSTARSSVQPTD
jgi:hypothetical protein